MNKAVHFLEMFFITCVIMHKECCMWLHVKGFDSPLLRKKYKLYTNQCVTVY